MKLRKLKYKDAALMLSWMHDSSITKYMQTNFATKTLLDCEKFIESAQKNSDNLHMAIINDDDIYMGTVSLKHITKSDAEFAITVSKEAMGKGYSKFGMQEIIQIGFRKMGLKKIYWCVSPKNKRAVRFYEKNGYQRIKGELPPRISKEYSPKQIKNYIWYQDINSL